MTKQIFKYNFNMGLIYPILTNVAYSVMSFLLTLQLIPGSKELFMKAGLKGKDMSKRKKVEM